MRYNLATLAELRVFEPLPYTLELDGERAPARRDAGRGRQRPVVRRRPADHRGRLARRRAARRGDHQADEQAGPGPDLPQAVQGHPHHAPAVRAPPGPQRSPSPRPASSAYADGERFGAAAADRRRRARGRCRCWCPDAARRRASPAERYADFRREPAAPGLRATSRSSTTSRSTTSRSGPARSSRTAAACWSPRRPARARRSSASSPSTSRSRPGRKCFYTTPIKALSNQKFARPGRAATAPTRSACSPATTPINGEAPIVVMTTEVLRNMLYAGSAHADRARLRRDGRGALPRRPVPRRGLGGGDHPPARVGGAGLAVRDGVQRRGVRRVAGDGARRHRPRSSRSAGRCRSTST